MRARVSTIATLFLVLMLGATGSVIAQGEGDENASVNETGVTPEDRPDSELPTERDVIGEDVAEPNPENEVNPDLAAEEEAGSLVYSGLAVLGVIAVSLLALMGVAYAAYQRGGRS